MTVRLRMTGAVRYAGQQLRGRREIGIVQGGERAAVRLAHRLVELGEDLEAGRGDPAVHAATIPLAPLATDEAPCLEPIDYARDARGALDHPPGHARVSRAKLRCEARALLWRAGKRQDYSTVSPLDRTAVATSRRSTR
jgi:hypothetical protein